MLAGLPPDEAMAYFADSAAPPLVPPSRGNFRVIAQTVVRGGLQAQEGVRALEIGLGAGTGLFIQAGLCADASRDPRARILLVNALAYLLGDRPPARAAAVYGRSADDLPACIARLQPRATRAGMDLRGDTALLCRPIGAPRCWWRAPPCRSAPKWPASCGTAGPSFSCSRSPRPIAISPP